HWYGACMGVAAAITVSHAEPGAAPVVDRVIPVEGTIDRELAGAAIEHAGSPGRTADVFAVTFDIAAGDPDDARFGMVSSLVGVFHGGASKLGERDDDDIVPGGFVRVE